MNKETTKQAATRHKLQVSTLYRRLARLQEAGQISLGSSDYVGGAIYLDASSWDEVCVKTRSPGRPRKTTSNARKN